MRGRDAELKLIERALRQGRSGSGSVVLVEGAKGMGKSLLLVEAAKAADALGYLTVAVVADELERMIPLYPLLSALGDVPEPAPFPASAFPAAADPDAQMRVMERVRRRLTALAVQGPVLITADDLQFADPVTLVALRMLPKQFASTTTSWIFARSTEQGADAERLFDLLYQDGAQRIQLQPLPHAAITELITDMLGAPPDDDLLSIAGGTGGNPLLVSELLSGLREENLLHTRDSRVALVSEHVPQRVQKFIRHQIETFQPETLQLIQVSAILGRSFAVEDAAEVLGQPAAALLPAINEALAGGVLVVDGEALSFRDSMTWSAVSGGIPDSVSRAIHRQIGKILLDRGSVLQAAGHLVRGLRPGDGKMVEELDGVVRQLLTRSPQTAADLAVRALELTGPDDTARGGRSVMAVRALAAAWRLEEAANLVETSLAASPPGPVRAQLRYARVSLLTLSSQPDRVRAEAEALLAEPDLPEHIRAETMGAWLRALGELPDLAAAEERARSVMREAGRSEGTVVAAAKALLAVIEWNRGDIAASLELFREAVYSAPDDTGNNQNLPFQSVLDYAARLTDLRRFDEAAAVVNTRRDDGDPASLAAAEAGPALLRARMHLAAGRIGAAISEIEPVLGIDRAADGSPYAITAQCMLGTIGLRRGDLRSAARWLDPISARLAAPGTGRVDVMSRILAGQLAQARDGPAKALEIVRGTYDYISRFRWPLIHDPSVAPWLIRLALAAGEERLAARVGVITDELRHANPDFPVVTAACAHARGLLDRDPGLLRLAAETQPDMWASASAAEDLAVLLADAGRVADAVEWLDHAYASFQGTDAGRDAARVRSRLRKLGVRRRSWQRVAAPSRGLDRLTETERDIAEMVAQGLTNRQIADLTFISPNTVAFHLRKMYRKLGIDSRVALTRIVLGNR